MQCHFIILDTGYDRHDIYILCSRETKENKEKQTQIERKKEHRKIEGKKCRAPPQGMWGAPPQGMWQTFENNALKKKKKKHHYKYLSTEKD